MMWLVSMGISLVIIRWPTDRSLVRLSTRSPGSRSREPALGIWPPAACCNICRGPLRSVHLPASFAHGREIPAQGFEVPGQAARPDVLDQAQHPVTLRLPERAPELVGEEDEPRQAGPHGLEGGVDARDLPLETGKPVVQGFQDRIRIQVAE